MKHRSPSTGIGGRDNRVPRPPGALPQQLERQIGFLLKSAREFDAGDENEAWRLASTLRTLLYDPEAPPGSVRPGQSISLLKQLGMKDGLHMVDTGLYRAPYDQARNEWLQREKDAGRVKPQNIILSGSPDCGLVVTGRDTNGNFAWVAPLGYDRFRGQTHETARKTPQPFETWWETPFIETSGHKLFSRKNLVLIMANQDGGAHVDPMIDADYADLTIDFLGLVASETTPEMSEEERQASLRPLAGNVAATSIRQVTYEVIRTLRPELPDLIPNYIEQIFRADMLIGEPMIEPDGRPMWYVAD